MAARKYSPIPNNATGYVSTRTLFESQLNVILPRPKLPADHPLEKAAQLLPPQTADYRSALKQYEASDEEAAEQIHDLHGVLSDSGAFVKEKKSNAFIFGKSGPPVADIIHFRAGKAVCRREHVWARDNGKLLFCHRASCFICSNHMQEKCGKGGVNLGGSKSSEVCV